MKVEYDGRVYEFNPADVTVDECVEVEKFCNARGLGEWSNQVSVANTKALQAYWWLLRRHAGEDPGPIARKDPGLRPIALHNALSDAEKAEAEAKAAAEAAAAEAAEDPTQPPPASSSPASSVTPTIPATAAATLSLPG